jgi:bisphosphoglycerate-independent phosphoglycerate mutase (AlkP superfamily)
MAKATNPVMLVILDGFSCQDEKAESAMCQPRTPTFMQLRRSSAPVVPAKL